MRHDQDIVAPPSPPGRRERGFTLIELLVVIGIIGILSAMVFPVVDRAIEQARQADCTNKLHQFSIAAFLYKEDHDDQFPPWLSTLYPKYLHDTTTYVCKDDKWRGTEGGKPAELIPIIGDVFDETDDTSANAHADRNVEITRCSYLYEFCAADCSWGPIGGMDAENDLNGDGSFSWYETKMYQLRAGDEYQSDGYTESYFPIIRCFHHWHDRKVPGKEYDLDGNVVGTAKYPVTLNVSYAGNVFRAPVLWEAR